MGDHRLVHVQGFVHAVDGKTGDRRPRTGIRRGVQDGLQVIAESKPEGTFGCRRKDIREGNRAGRGGVGQVAGVIHARGSKGKERGSVVPVRRRDSLCGVVAVEVVRPPEGQEFGIDIRGGLVLPLLPVHKGRPETEASGARIDAVGFAVGIVVSLFAGPEGDDVGIALEPEVHRFVHIDGGVVQEHLELRVIHVVKGVGAGGQRRDSSQITEYLSVCYHPGFCLSKGLTLISRAGTGQTASRLRTEE